MVVFLLDSLTKCIPFRVQLEICKRNLLEYRQYFIHVIAILCHNISLIRLQWKDIRQSPGETHKHSLVADRPSHFWPKWKPERAGLKFTGTALVRGSGPIPTQPQRLWILSVQTSSRECRWKQCLILFNELRTCGWEVVRWELGSPGLLAGWFRAGDTEIYQTSEALAAWLVSRPCTTLKAPIHTRPPKVLFNRHTRMVNIKTANFTAIISQNILTS